VTAAAECRDIEATLPERGRWPVELSIDAYGVRVGLRASVAGALPALERAVPPGARVRHDTAADDIEYSIIANDDERTHRVFVDEEPLIRGASLEEATSALESHLQFHVAVAARTRLFVHAGVVGWRGGAILLPGRTFAGKSALVAALVGAGATYYSDEYAVLDDAGRVHPFARTLSLRDATGRARRVSPEALGAIGDAALPVRFVIATRYLDGAEWRPRAMSPGETVLALLENTLAVRTRPADAVRMLAAAVRGAAGIRGLRGDASVVVEHLLALYPTPSV
jgi:hypothetical protein